METVRTKKTEEGFSSEACVHKPRRRTSMKWWQSFHCPVTFHEGIDKLVNSSHALHSVYLVFLFPGTSEMLPKMSILCNRLKCYIYCTTKCMATSSLFHVYHPFHFYSSPWGQCFSMSSEEKAVELPSLSLIPRISKWQQLATNQGVWIKITVGWPHSWEPRTSCFSGVSRLARYHMLTRSCTPSNVC